MTTDVDLDRLRISPYRPHDLPLPWPKATELARARAVGLVEPVIARPIPGTQPSCYEILTGLKHWLLAQRLPRATMPVLVQAVDDTVARRWVEADAANAAARDPLVEARTIQQRVSQGLSVAAAGLELGLSRTDASHRLRLLRLAPEIQDQLARGELAPGLARALVGLEETRQLALAGRIRRERLNARQVEALAKAWKTGGTEPSWSATINSPQSVRDPDQLRLEQALAELLGTLVTLHCDPSGRGQLVINFANLDILDGVLAGLGYLP